MERAAKAITTAIMNEWTEHTPVVVFAGPGNNGGDALAVARLLAAEGFIHISLIYIINCRPTVKSTRNGLQIPNK